MQVRPRSLPFLLELGRTVWGPDCQWSYIPGTVDRSFEEEITPSSPRRRPCHTQCSLYLLGFLSQSMTEIDYSNPLNKGICLICGSSNSASGEPFGHQACLPGQGLEPTQRAISRWVLGWTLLLQGLLLPPPPLASWGPSSARRPHTGSGHHADPGLPPADGPPRCAAVDKTPALSEHCIVIPCGPAPDLEQLTAEGRNRSWG